MRKILYCLKSPGIGGAELQLLLLAKELKQRYQVQPIFIFVGLEKRALLPLLAEQNIKYYNINKSKSGFHVMFNVFRITSVMLVHKINGVIAFLDEPSMLTSLASSLVPSSRFHIWGIRSSKISFRMNRWYRYALGKSDYLISNSLQGKKNFETFASSNKIKVNVQIINNGVHIPKVLSVNSKEHLNILMIANVRSPKRYDIVLELINLLAKHMDMNVTFHLVGAGTIELLNNVTQEIRPSYVQAHGRVDRVESFLETANLGLLLTDHEGQPNAILEYMAYGLPIIASDLPEIRAVMPSESFDYLVSNDNIKELIDKLSQLVLNPKIRQTLGHNNLKHCIDHYDAKLMVASYWELIAKRID